MLPIFTFFISDKSFNRFVNLREIQHTSKKNVMQNILTNQRYIRLLASINMISF